MGVNSISAISTDSELLINTEQTDIDYNSDTNLIELSTILSIPVSKLREYFELPENIDEDKTLYELGITNNSINEASIKFEKEKWQYSLNIVLVGMIVIFSSLSLTGLFISQLRRIGGEKKYKSISKNLSDKEHGKRISTNYANNHNNIIAAIATLKIYTLEAEENEKLIIAWNREPVSVWKTSGKLQNLIRNNRQ